MQKNKEPKIICEHLLKFDQLQLKIDEQGFELTEKIEILSIAKKTAHHKIADFILEELIEESDKEYFATNSHLHADDITKSKFLASRINDLETKLTKLISKTELEFLELISK